MLAASPHSLHMDALGRRPVARYSLPSLLLRRRVPSDTDCQRRQPLSAAGSPPHARELPPERAGGGSPGRGYDPGRRRAGHLVPRDSERGGRGVLEARSHGSRPGPSAIAAPRWELDGSHDPTDSHARAHQGRGVGGRPGVRRRRSRGNSSSTDLLPSQQGVMNRLSEDFFGDRESWNNSDFHPDPYLYRDSIHQLILMLSQSC